MAPGRKSTGRLTALVRGLLPDRNPLRRTADRVEAAVLGLVLAGFLAGAPLAALTAGGWAGTASQRARQAEAGWQPVRATLLQNTPAGAAAMYQGLPRRQAEAAWTAPDGAIRVGKVYAPAGLRAGEPVTIWTNRLGRIVGYPVQRLDVIIRSALAGLLAVAGLAIFLGAVWLAARKLLDRRRLAAWDVGWAEAGPHWTGKR